MRIIPVGLLATALLFTCACGGPAQADNSASADEAQQNPSIQEDVSGAAVLDETGAGNAAPGSGDRGGLMGRIVSVSDSEITIELAEMNRSPSDGENSPGEPPAGGPGGDASQPPEDQQASGDSQRPDGEQRGGGMPGGGFMDFDYTGEQKTYAISGEVTATKGMGGNGEELAITDLQAGDIVRLQLNEGEDTLVSIQVMETSAATAENSQ